MTCKFLVILPFLSLIDLLIYDYGDNTISNWNTISKSHLRLIFDTLLLTVSNC